MSQEGAFAPANVGFPQDRATDCRGSTAAWNVRCSYHCSRPSSSHWSWHVRAEPAGRCLANTGHPLIEGSSPGQVPNYARRVCEWSAQLAQGNPSICAKTS